MPVNKEWSVGDIFLSGCRPCLWIVLIGLSLYAWTVFFGLSYLDDNILILENYEFLGKLTNIVEAFRQDVFHVLHEYDAAYRPLLTISFMVDAQLDRIFGLGYHFTNVLFHLTASCLVFLFFLKLKYSRPASFFFSLVFVVHPALTQAVAWIPGRNDSILGVLIMSSFICLLEFLEHEKRAYMVWHIIFFIWALLTKEVALVLLPVSIFYFIFVAKRKPLPLAQIQLLVGWFLAIGLWYALRHYALSQSPVTMSIMAILRDLARGAPAIVMYAGKALFPFNLSIVPTIEDTNMIYGIASIAVIISGLALSKNKRYGFILFGIVWFASFLVPTFIQPMAMSSVIFLEARMYLPMLGIFIILGEIDSIKNITFKNKPTLLYVLMIALLFFCMGADYSGNFQNAVVFWEYAVKKSPHSPMAHSGLGWVYSAEGRPDEAEDQFRKALALDPRQRYAHNSLGNIYERRGWLEKAEEEYIMEIENTPYNEKAYLNLAGIYLRQGKLAKAKELWEETLRLNPDNLAAREFLDAQKKGWTGRFPRKNHDIQKRG